MHKRLILLLTTIAMVVIGTSLAQEVGTIDSGNNGMMDLGMVIDPDIPSPMIIIDSGGQGMTGVDTGLNISLGLEFTGTNIPSLPGGQEIWTGVQLLTTGTTGDLSAVDLQPLPQPHLIISEVYYDGTDERIEITNIGDSEFSGKIILSGVKSSLLTINNVIIHPGASKIYGDNLSQISGEVIIGKTGLSLSLIDTATIRISLIISSQIKDNFVVDQYRVNKYNNKKTSFEKIGNIITPIISSRVANAQPNHLINPGHYFITGEKLVNVSFPPGGFVVPIPCDSISQSGLVKIDEIFRGNENYPPYIELSIHDNITIDQLSLSGDILSSDVVFSRDSSGITLEKNQKFLISNTGFRKYQEQLPGEQNNNFSLVSTGKFLLITIGYGQSGQVMDIVYLSGNMPGKSSYFNSSTYQCVRIMDSLDDFSPGFEKKFLKYMSVKTIKKIQYIHQNPGSDPDSSGVNIPGQNHIQPFIPQEYSIKIIDIEYDPPGADTNKEKITLLATHISGDATPLDMSKTFRVKVNGRNKLLSGILPMGVPTTFTKTFGFPNSTASKQDVIITLNHGDHIFDTYTYNPNKLSDKEKKELTGTGYYVSSVIDGDSFRIRYQGRTQTVRMIGINAPESNLRRHRHLECFGVESKMHLKNLIDKKRITFKFDEFKNQRDHYGRLLAYVYIDGEFVNLSMIEDGYVKEYTYKTPYQYQSKFKQAELMAKKEGVGLWSERICGFSLSGFQRSGDLEGTGNILNLSGFDFTITYVLPNPKGADTNEKLGLIINYQGQMINDEGNNEDVLDTDHSSLVTELDMNYGFTLRVGNRKKDIRGNPKIGQEYVFSGNLGLVNKAACVSLRHEENELAKFCYPKPKEGQKIYSSYADFEEIDKESIDILNELRMKRIGKNICAVYKDSSIICRRIPASKAERKTIQERRLYKGFTSLIRSYLMNNWKPLYYDTDIKRYYDLLSSNKKLIRQGYTKVDIYGQKILVTNIRKQLEVIERTPLLVVAVFEGGNALLNNYKDGLVE